MRESAFFSLRPPWHAPYILRSKLWTFAPRETVVEGEKAGNRRTAAAAKAQRSEVGESVLRRERPPPPARSRHEPAGLGKAFSILNTGCSAGAKTPFDLGVVASLITGEAFRQLPPLTGPQDFMKKSPILNDSGSFWTSQPELASLPFFVLEVDIYEPWPALGTRVQMPAPQVAQPAHCSQQRPWADPEP